MQAQIRKVIQAKKGIRNAGLDKESKLRRGLGMQAQIRKVIQGQKGITAQFVYQ